ncbi:MAG: hypothetical protein A3I66_22530 [Burkholderiales bacterium RIFCSPLOWO2_02_FULL_57_36]|nr:MAG: hypothetical protein A3I66_22530 [Burkholderiales bacterium RIFCSPLOWO2_02_FULL_57_36]
MNVLFVLNAAPYGSESTYNGLRLAGALAKREHNIVRIYLMGDAAGAAKSGQKVPPGYYKVQLMLQAVVRNSAGNVGVCGTCMDARGIEVNELIEGTHRGTLEELADWSEWADKIFVF